MKTIENERLSQDVLSEAEWKKRTKNHFPVAWSIKQSTPNSNWKRIYSTMEAIAFPDECASEWWRILKKKNISDIQAAMTAPSRGWWRRPKLSYEDLFFNLHLLKYIRQCPSAFRKQLYDKLMEIQGAEMSQRDKGMVSYLLRGQEAQESNKEESSESKKEAIRGGEKKAHKIPFDGIHLAAIMGDEDLLKKCYQQDPSCINKPAPLDGLTPFHLAIFFAHDKIMKSLLQKGADLNTPARSDVSHPGLLLGGSSPLCWAIALKHTEYVNLLYRYQAFNVHNHPKKYNPLEDPPVDKRRMTALSIAARGGDLKMVSYLVEIRHDVLSSNVLWEAAKNHHREVVRYLIEKKTSLKALYKDGMWEGVISEAFSDDPELKKILVSYREELEQDQIISGPTYHKIAWTSYAILILIVAVLLGKWIGVAVAGFCSALLAILSPLVIIGIYRWVIFQEKPKLETPSPVHGGGRPGVFVEEEGSIIPFIDQKDPSPTQKVLPPDDLADNLVIPTDSHTRD